MDKASRRYRIVSGQTLGSWSHSLAVARPGAHYRVTAIVYSPVRERCDELSLGQGDEFRCIENEPRALDLQCPDGRRIVMERDFAWFVQVERIPPSADGGEARSTY